jgi:hypothetical protein
MTKYKLVWLSLDGNVRHAEWYSDLDAAKRDRNDLRQLGHRAWIEEAPALDDTRN